MATARTAPITEQLVLTEKEAAKFGKLRVSNPHMLTDFLRDLENAAREKPSQDDSETGGVQ